jgi:DNA gyrase subunit B
MTETSPREKDIQAQFSSRAPIYDGSANWIHDEGMLDLYVQLCQVPKDAVLLDVCTGTGQVGGHFRGRVGRIVGVDLTEGMLEKARTRLDEVVVGRAEALPFPDETFDIAIIRQALHFVDTPVAALREMYRVLKKGGQAIIGHRVPYGEADAAWWERVNRKKQPLIKHLLLEETLLAAIREAGFADLEPHDYFLWESIQHWLDSPEARPGGESVLSLYQEAPPEAVRIRGIEIGEKEIKDRWRWLLVSCWKR